MQVLIDMGAWKDFEDKNANGVVELAVLHFHTRILEWLIGQNFNELPVFDKLAKMLVVEDRNNIEAIRRAAAAARCIDVLTSKHSVYWNQLLASGAVKGLVQWLILPPDVAERIEAEKKKKSTDSPSESDDESSSSPTRSASETPSRSNKLSAKRQRAKLRSAKLLSQAMTGLISASVSALCNIGSENSIRSELARLGAGERLAELLVIPDVNIQARAATVLADVCADPDQQVFHSNISPKTSFD